MRRFVIFLLILLWLPAHAVQLAWDASLGAAGYLLYYGANTGVYSTMIDAETNLTVHVSGLQPGSKTYFVVTAYNSSGQESDYSSEIIYTEPLTPPPPIVVTNTVITVDHAGRITGPWTNVVSLTNVVEAAGFWRVNITKSTNTP